MALIKKHYALPLKTMLNVIFDVQEMRKAKLIRSTEDTVEMVVETYMIKTAYRFHLEPNHEGTAVTVESGGDSDNANNNVAFMLAMMDGIISSIPAPPYGGSG